MAKSLRVRLSNAHGTRPLTIGAAHVGLRAERAAVVPGSNRKLTFGGDGSATIATGALLISDPVELDVPPLADVAVTVHLPGSASFGITGRYARVTNYISPLGNFADADAMPVSKLTDDWYIVAGIDVLAETGTGGVVALGDSLTDGNIATHDAWANWPSQLARRLAARRGGRPMGVMNQGLGGNRILHDIRGDSGLRRFDRDVLAQPGVTHVIVLLGTNDLRNRWAKPEEEANAPALIAGLKQLALRAHARGIKIFGGTHHAVRERDLLAWRLDSGARADTPGRQRLDQDEQRVRCGHRFRCRRARSGAADQHAAEVGLWRPPASERRRL